MIAAVSEDQISPRAITRCDLCKVKNGARGGRTTDGNFHPAYESDPTIGRIGWCGTTGPEHLLRVMRIVCKPVDMGAGETLNLCQRCEHEVANFAARTAEGVAA